MVNYMCRIIGGFIRMWLNKKGSCIVIFRKRWSFEVALHTVCLSTL